MEGHRPARRKPRTTAVQKEIAEHKSRSKVQPEQKVERENFEEIKEESGQPFFGLYEQAPAEQSTRIKDEPFENIDPYNVDDKEWTSLHSYSDPENYFIDPNLENVDFTSTEAFPARESKPRVKTESIWN